jgi:hydrogenase nickel incorporation protein HypA/HybF
MHEFSLAKTLIGQVDRLRQEHAGARVISVCVEVGELSGVELELLQSAFGVLTAESPLRGTNLELQAVPLVAHCDACGHEFQVRRFTFRCSKCDDTRLTLLRGEHLVLREVTLEGMDDQHE